MWILSELRKKYDTQCCRFCFHKRSVCDSLIILVLSFGNRIWKYRDEPKNWLLYMQLRVLMWYFRAHSLICFFSAIIRQKSILQLLDSGSICKYSLRSIMQWKIGVFFYWTQINSTFASSLVWESENWTQRSAEEEKLLPFVLLLLCRSSQDVE